uniref:SJCHGC09034 protein n=1 Tax=Schistosoma japonicum TaxID=6182 RepID=Q5DFB4_SCHJA|nr:SJCHGC09034 protein [Schistosoma japonicum]
MTFVENSPECITALCNFMDPDNVSNIRPEYRNKFSNSCHLTVLAGQQTEAIRNSSTDFLGYDWIASMVDNQIRPIRKDILYNHKRPSSSYGVDEQWLNQRELFDKLNKFRQTNSELCCSQQPISVYSKSKKVFQKEPSLYVKRVRPLPPIRANVSSPNDSISRPQPIVQIYTLNSRYFSIRTDVLVENGKHEDKTNTPVILRISIPSHRFKSTKTLNGSSDFYRKYNQQSSHSLRNTISLIGHCNYSMGTKLSY